MALISKMTTLDGVTHYLRERNYTECTSAQSAQAKTVSLDGFSLATGEKLYVKFHNGNDVDNPTLSVNNGDAKPIVNSLASTQVHWAAGSVIEMVYSGSSWVIPAPASPLELEFYIDADGDLCQVD